MKYIKPEFDVTVYEVEDVITLSFPEEDYEEDPNEPWFG